jgi:hypothetical protein
MSVTDLKKTSTIGITKLFKGHSLLLDPAKAALHKEKPSVVAPRLTSSASALSSRLRAFLPELAAANEALAKRVLQEGPNAVDMNIKVSTSEDLDEEEEEEEKEEEEVDNMESMDIISDIPIGPQIEMNISLHELLPGSILECDDGEGGNEVEEEEEEEEDKQYEELMKTTTQRRVLIEEVDSSSVVNSGKRISRDDEAVNYDDDGDAVNESSALKRIRQDKADSS